MDNHLSKIAQTVLKPFQDLFFPPVCLHCQTVLTSSTNQLSLCQSCCQSLALMPPHFPHENILNKLESPFIDQIAVAYQYDEVIQSIIHNIKYRKMPDLGIKTGELAARTLGMHLEKIPARKFLPVPLHPVRQKERGYNQSTFIGNGIIKIQGGDLLEHILVRSKNTVSQTKLNRQERQENVHQAFHIRQGAGIAGKTFILVDDLITTGATINECARVLKEKGAERVIGIAVASPVDLEHQ